ncbi:LD-carboxypeptidase [Neobacillus notoginsengisoli]|uniref:LD-carboxypeptidase n=1 Tax=Neobacillus notoginsengisoli TaxID=1578198 RepID=A0A417YX01_9BACI|nr:S66 peptidase family protein [Neobacillus notoginsengisoli]RHW42018.1 LD-carboxypeptidase [Neobacillus notoginsengisoli]
MISYPTLPKGATIGVTAPSSGVPKELHQIVHQAVERLERMGYQVVCGDTVRTDEKTRSASASVRAEEFMAFMSNERVDAIIPPWGGELLIEILDKLDFASMKSKWVLGYSDTSALLLAITLRTGIATAHGTNLVDLRGEFADPTTAMWETVLSTGKSSVIIQTSSNKYQKEWRHDNPSPCVFHLTEPTVWRFIPKGRVEMSGRLLGGCIDIIRHLIGTPFGDIRKFRESHIPGEPVIWYFENCSMNTTDLRRTLVQMKLAGWFNNCSGILFGRSPANDPVENYTIEDVYNELYEDLRIPIMFDIDCGHVPPQITFINGAYAEVEAENGAGIVRQIFK